LLRRDASRNNGESVRQDPFTIGYIGRLSEGKRFQDLLEAAAILREKGLNLQIKAAGSFVDAAYEAKIRDLLLRHNLADSVELLGYQSDLESLYQSLDLLVVPSYNEPFGRVVIEAMAYDVPCVATRSGGIPEIVTDGETGWLYPAKDSKALASVLESLIKAPEQMKPVREKAGRMVKDRFTIEGQMGKLDACYQEILRQNP
jgi:glycosyltransferase involved in cell wall biosynthesis